tara:strand:- start:338 stop:775 length:438 start_codon:yes stop_codon:yes gene_type:complete
MPEWIDEVSPFLTVPERLARGGGVAWLSRHSGQSVWVDVASFERSMRKTVLPARPANWTYIDHRAAWACETPLTPARHWHRSDYFDGAPLHLVHQDRSDSEKAAQEAAVAVARDVANKTGRARYYYLSMLRTLEAVRQLPAVLSS